MTLALGSSPTLAEFTIQNKLLKLGASTTSWSNCNSNSIPGKFKASLVRRASGELQLHWQHYPILTWRQHPSCCPLKHTASRTIYYRAQGWSTSMFILRLGPCTAALSFGDVHWRPVAARFDGAFAFPFFPLSNLSPQAMIPLHLSIQKILELSLWGLLQLDLSSPTFESIYFYTCSKYTLDRA